MWDCGSAFGARWLALLRTIVHATRSLGDGGSGDSRQRTVETWRHGWRCVDNCCGLSGRMGPAAHKRGNLWRERQRGRGAARRQRVRGMRRPSTARHSQQRPERRGGSRAVTVSDGERCDMRERSTSTQFECMPRYVTKKPSYHSLTMPCLSIRIYI